MQKAVLSRGSSCYIGGKFAHSPRWLFEEVTYSIPRVVYMNGTKAPARKRYVDVPGGRRLDLVTGVVEVKNAAI